MTVGLEEKFTISLENNPLTFNPSWVIYALFGVKGDQSAMQFLHLSGDIGPMDFFALA